MRKFLTILILAELAFGCSVFGVSSIASALLFAAVFKFADWIEDL